jgi:hypothetical protein
LQEAKKLAVLHGSFVFEHLEELLHIFGVELGGWPFDILDQLVGNNFVKLGCQFLISLN